MEQSWIDAQTIGYLIISGLAFLAGKLIHDWATTWKSRILKQDRRLDLQHKILNRHEMEIVALTKDVEHIRDTSDETKLDVRETKEDVKQLLKIANGGTNRTSG